MIIKEKTIKVTANRKRWISMWRNKDGEYCIGYLHYNGLRAVYRKGQRKYIERMWRNYK